MQESFASCLGNALKFYLLISHNALKIQKIVVGNLWKSHFEIFFRFQSELFLTKFIPVLLDTKKNIIWTGQGFGHYRKVFMIASELDLNFFVSISNNVSTISEWFC